MAKEANIEATKRWGAEVASAGEYDVLDEILASGFIDNDPAPDQAPGIEGLKDFFRTMRTAFPDLKAEVVKIVATDDHVAMRYTLSGTHRGEFRGVPASGNSFDIAALQIARFENGKCVERWGSTDELGMLEQIGILEQVAGRSK